MRQTFVHPYMPNSVPAIRQAMLEEIGVDSIEEIYRTLIPEELIFQGRLDLPEAIESEYELKQHVMGLLKKNITTEEYTSFLGAGCYRHQVPAICDELNMRGEFLTGYCGDTYSDHGKMQAIFEYTSMMGELLDTDVVSYTLYDAGQAVSSAFRMANRIQLNRGNKPEKVLVPSTMNPEILSQATAYCKGFLVIEPVKATPDGRMDLADLEARLRSASCAAVFYENPSYLGFFEAGAERIAELAHAHGALVIAQPEVASLGVVESPINLGADILCGDIQPLGMHIQFGGGQAGFLACRQEIEFMQEFPTYLYGICETREEGRFGWGRAMNERSSHGSRENAREYFGTETGLWAITAAIYLASMGPQGMAELGESILQKTAYAEQVLGTVPGIRVNPFGASNFQEFLIRFDDTGKTVSEVNRALLARKIFGGKDLSRDFPAYGESALYCISELTTREEIERLRDVLAEITGR